jgi:hypothetical protein
MWVGDAEERIENTLSGNKDKKEREENDLCGITERKMYLF